MSPHLAAPREGPDPPTALRRWLAGQTLPADARHVAWSNEFEGRSGRGCRIALLDSCLHWHDEIFAASTIVGRDFTRSGQLGSSSRHGTISAALLAGRGWYTGLAPECDLLFAKVLGVNRRVSGEAIIRAIRWATGEQAHVIVLPFGSPGPSPGITRALRVAVDQGISVFAAAGRRCTDRASFPARLPIVTAVGVVDRCRAACPADIVTYGVDVPAADPAPTQATGASVATVLAAALHVLRCSAAPAAALRGLDGGAAR